MFSKHQQLIIFILILIKTIFANSDDGYVTNFSRTSSYVSKQATNREELDRSSNLEKELSKLRANTRDPCGGGRLQHSANLQDGTGSVACTSNEYKVTSDKLRDVDLSKTGLSKLNLGSTSSHHDVSSKLSTSSSSLTSSKTYSAPYVVTSKTSSSDSAPLDRYTSYTSTNIKSDLPSYSRYSESKTQLTHTKTDLLPSRYTDDSSKTQFSNTKLDLSTDLDRRHYVTSSPIYHSNLNINTNSGQLASKLTNQIDAANSHLDASSKILSQQHSGQSTVGRSIHGLHADTHSLSNSQNQHYATSFQSKTYGGSSTVDFSGHNYGKTKISDHSHLHVDSKTNQPAYTKTFDVKGTTTIHSHNDKLRILDHSIKGAPLKDHHGTSVLITEEEERRIENERRKNIVRLNSSDKLNSHISTNKTDTFLFCESGEMLVKINFTKKFFGIVYANSRDSTCRILGNGDRNYELHIPLNGCGTKKDERLFVNNITVRFHQTLELEDDEIKTIICRYPPPAAPIPVIPLIPIKPAPPAPIIASKLSEIELILVICFLLFLPILLLGIGISYYGLKRRNIKIIRKRRLHSGAPSQITKISHSTFEPVRIPRVAVSDYTSESETRTILSDSSSIRRDQYHTQKLQHIPELKVQLLDTTYLANQRFVEEETENIVNKKLTTNYFKKVPPLPYSTSIPDNDCWSHSEFTDVVEQKEVTISKPAYTVKTEKERFIDLEKDMSIEERLIKNKNITLPTPQPKYQVKNINDTFITNIKETATSCEKLCDYVANNQEWQTQHGGQRSNYLSRSSSLKYEDSFLYERKFNVLKNLFDQPLPSSVSPPKAGFSYMTSDEKTRWYNLITTDESFRSLMIESSTYEEYINVSRDLRYEHYFSKKTWETIINTLTNREIIARWNANVYEDQKFNDNVELSFNSETQELLKQSQQEQKQFGGSETISYSKQINKLVDGARERLMEQQFESSQSVYRSGGGGNLMSIPRLSSTSTRTAEHKALLDQEEVKSVTETQVDDHYYKRTLRK